MKTLKFEAVAVTAYKRKLDTPLPYGGDYEAYESFAEMKAANDLLKDDEQLRARNSRRKQQAVTKAKELALEAIGIVKPDMKNSPEFRLKAMYDILRAAGVEHDEARSIAAANLKMEWSDEEDDE